MKIEKYSERLKHLIVGFTTYFVFATYAHAAAVSVSVATMIENIANTIPDLMLFTTALAYVMGFFFVFNGLMHLKKYGESRTMMSSEAHLKGPLIYLAVGAALIYLPSSVQVGLGTFWENPMPYAYDTGQTDPWSELYNACFLIIQLIGTIAFIRGLIILTHMGGHSSQPGTFGRAMAHMIGGILCIDLYDFVQAIFTTLGISWEI